MLLLSLDCSTLPSICTLYCWVLSKEVSSTIFKVFSMTRPGIEPRSPGPLANTLPSRPMNCYTRWLQIVSVLLIRKCGECLLDLCFFWINFSYMGGLLLVDNFVRLKIQLILRLTVWWFILFVTKRSRWSFVSLNSTDFIISIVYSDLLERLERFFNVFWGVFHTKMMRLRISYFTDCRLLQVTKKKCMTTWLTCLVGFDW